MREKNLFLFLFQFFKAIFQKILNPLLNLNETTQYKNSNAAAWMLNHVSTLIFDFKLIKIITFLSLYAHKIHKNDIHLFLNHAKILGCYIQSSKCLLLYITF
jgi:hypothetical protein